MEFKLGILGFGNMGSAIAEGALLKGVVKAGNVYVYNRSNPAMLRAEELGFNTVSNENELWESSDIILLAVKPQYMEEALSAVKKASTRTLSASRTSCLENRRASSRIRSTRKAIRPRRRSCRPSWTP